MSRPTVRCLFVMDRQVNGATPAVSDILNISDWQSFNNLANSHRFRILSDKLYTINCTAGGYTGTSDIGFAKSMHGSISLPKMIVNYIDEDSIYEYFNIYE